MVLKARFQKPFGDYLFDSLPAAGVRMGVSQSDCRQVKGYVIRKRLACLRQAQGWA